MPDTTTPTMSRSRRRHRSRRSPGRRSFPGARCRSDRVRHQPRTALIREACLDPPFRPDRDAAVMHRRFGRGRGVPVSPAVQSSSGAGRDVPSCGNAGFGPAAVRLDVEVENLGGDGDRAAGIRDIDDAAHPALDRSGAEDDVALFTRVPELLQALAGVEAGAKIGDMPVAIELLTRYIVDRDAFDEEVFGI